MKAVQKIMLMVIICVAATWGGTRIPHVQSQSDNLGACDDEQIVQILNDINEYRTRGGLRAPFVPNETLCRLAQEHAIAIELEQTYPGDWTLRKDGTSLKEWAKATDFQPYPKDDYAVDMRLFHSTVYDYMAIVNYLVSIEPDQEAYQDFFESIEYREIGIGYVPTSEGYIYVFIVGSQPNILPVIPVYESLPYIAQYNFPSGEAQLWIADERYYTGTDLSTIGALSMMRITSTEEKEACPTIQAEIGEWQPYQSPIRHTIPAAEGQITCYVQLCDQVGRSIVMPVRVYIASTTAPVADFEAVPLQGSAPLTVRFNNKSSGNIESYSWDFNGDALADSFKEDAEYTYSQPNVYTVKLTVMGYDGMISDATQEIRVEPPVVLPEPPTAAFTANPISGPAPLVVTFQNQSTGDITAYAWDFNGDTLTDSAELNPQYRFETQGNYPVTLTVNGPGGTDTETLVINVTGSIPVEANFEMAPDQGPAPLTVVFTNTSTGEGLTYNWDFDSDSYMDSAEANPSHTYNQQGRYVVKLYVTAADGRTDS
ncbi:MAG TPA: PKD domain-containing protein, partial [Aggregatilineaceae bacterium]|nr:PKD domain-containing protein [Aggregatilineaceae bacterium]